MSIRCVRSTGPVVLALAVAMCTALAIGIGVPRAGAAAQAPTPAPAAAASTGGPTLLLVHQTPFVVPNPPGSPQDLVLDLSATGAPAGDRLVATVYNRLEDRSSFEQTLNSTPSGVLDRTHPVPLSGLPTATRGGVNLTVAVEPTTTAAPAPPAGTPTLVLHCPPDTGSCPGVYPVVVALESAGGAVVSHLTTYLTYAETTSSHPLRFAWVVPVSAPVAIRTDTRDPAAAVAPPAPATVSALAGLAASLQHTPGVAVTLAASPQTLQALADGGSTGQQAVATLRDLAANQQVHEFLGRPYVPIDLGALAGAGEPTEIAAQMHKGAAVMAKLGVPTSPGPGVWVATGAVGSALGTGLAQIGASQVVVPDSSLAPATSAPSNGTWTSTFQLNLGRGSVPTAAAGDGGLAAHFTADPRDPALEANQLLADLAMIHFEAPNATAVRGVVALPPRGWTPGAAFDDELLGGLQGNPDVQATTISTFFSDFPTASTLPTRHPSSPGPGPVLAPGQAHQFTTARLRLTAFDGAVQGNPPVLSQLDQLLLASESDDLTSSGQVAGVASFERSLGGQLSLVSFATERAITLTARTGPIPVTVLSAAPYTLVGTLHLTSDRFQFPQGASQKLVLDHPTNPVRIQVEARTSGDLPMQVTFVSPNGGLVIARGQLTVRSTATSIVGVVLTALALLVLLSWWARTWWSGRKRRAHETRRGADR